ncbi:hypothetical protein NM688_g2345 [Phlebia brevispora]|uniref:Uncharacterized protein n=1 Tax=Phlebia brevispora TaxID=194682 RepID=A0ACC1T8S0_9APHY|nr:hypothetical protein NM688_g2345 [Phlebia brevispora]
MEEELNLERYLRLCNQIVRIQIDPCIQPLLRFTPTLCCIVILMYLDCTCRLPKSGRTPRNLVVCIDGTSNKFSKDMNVTNVIKLYNLIEKDEQQLTFYNSGIGTYARPSRWSPRHFLNVCSHLVDQAIAWKFEKIILDAYRWLSDHYEDGDRIYLLGFSRGAYQVRVLSAMIYRVGLIYKGNTNQIPFAYELYEEQPNKDLDLKHLLRKTMRIENRKQTSPSNSEKNSLKGESSKKAAVVNSSANADSSTKSDAASGPHSDTSAGHKEASTDAPSHENLSEKTTVVNSSANANSNAKPDAASGPRSSTSLGRKEASANAPSQENSSEQKTPADWTEPPCEVFKKAFCRNVNVHFVGAWDTVSSIGIMRGESHPDAVSGMRHVCYFRHALALDERRVKFLPEYVHGGATLSSTESSPGSIEDSDSNPHTKEVWFSGTHSDIGGATRQPHQSDNRPEYSPALEWMIMEAAEMGLRMHPLKHEHLNSAQSSTTAPSPSSGDSNPSRPTDVVVKPAKQNASETGDPADSLSRRANSLKGLWWLLEWIPVRRLSYKDNRSTTRKLHRGAGRIIVRGQKVHESALENSGGYTPTARFARKVWGDLRLSASVDEEDPSVIEQWGPLKHARDYLEAETHEGLQKALKVLLEASNTKSGKQALRQAGICSVLQKVPKSKFGEIDLDDLHSIRHIFDEVYEKLIPEKFKYEDLQPCVAYIIAHGSDHPREAAFARKFISEFTNLPPVTISVLHKLDYDSPVIFASFLPDTESNHVIAASEDGRIRIWNVRENRKVFGFPSKETIRSFACSPDGRYAVSTSHRAKGVPRARQLHKGETSRFLLLQPQPQLPMVPPNTDADVNSSGTTPTHTTNTNGATNAGVNSNSGTTPTLTTNVNDTTNVGANAKSGNATPAPRTNVNGTPNTDADVNSGRTTLAPNTNTNGTTNANANPNSGDTAHTPTNSNTNVSDGFIDKDTLQIWEIDHATLKESIFLDDPQLSRKSPTQRKLVEEQTLLNSSHLHVYGKHLLQLVQDRFEKKLDDVECIAFSPDSRFAACGKARTNSGAGVGNGSLEPGQESLLISIFQQDSTHFKKFTDLGTHLANKGSRIPSQAYVTSLVFSGDSRHLIAGGSDARIRIWSTKNWCEEVDFQAHDRAINAVAVSEDDKRIVSCSDDGTVRVWDANVVLKEHTCTPEKCSSHKKLNPHGGDETTPGDDDVAAICIQM